MRRWQNVPDYRVYADRVLSGQSATGSIENLTSQMKRAERIALSLRTHEGIPNALVQDRHGAAEEFIGLGLLQQSNGNFVLTRKGKSLADSVVEAFL
jgi:coproporphyrinogen III oxidase-like Fe-S oxidoreductase